MKSIWLHGELVKCKRSQATAHVLSDVSVNLARYDDNTFYVARLGGGGVKAGRISAIITCLQAPGFV